MCRNLYFWNDLRLIFLNMNRIVPFAIALLFSGLLCQAQRGQISIEQDPGIAALMGLYEKSISDTEFYTIQVGFGGYDEARELKESVELDFPQWRARIVFDSPTYRVQVGRFQNRLDAEREFLEVRKEYPGALLLRPEKKDRLKKPDSKKPENKNPEP